MTEATPPGPARSWVEFLPPPFDSNPEVAVVMVANGAGLMVRECEHGAYKGLRVAFMEELGENGYRIPVHVVNKDLGNYFQHQKVVREMGGELAPLAYRGPLADIHQRCLMSEDFWPLIILWHEANHRPCHLRLSIKNITGEING